MATASQKTHEATQLAGNAATSAESAAFSFGVVEDNSGHYRWRIVGSGGESLAYSQAFTTYDDAANGASLVRDGAASAQFERRPVS